MNRGGFEFSFAWLFAIIVGVVIIFLAIYFTTSLIGNSRYEADTKIAAQLETILNPVETGLEEGKLIIIGFPSETRIYNDCNEFGDFGDQAISTSTKSGIGDKWQEPGAKIKSKSKYIFSEKVVQGQEAYVFVKPFEMPYKVADMVMIYSQDYCFVKPFDDIKEEVEDLNLPGINISFNIDDCPEGSKKVCFVFDNDECDVKVGQTNVQEAYYEDSLVYGAIFSSPDIYECQLKRLMKRDAELALLYASKAEFLVGKGCSTGLAGELVNYASSLEDFGGSRELPSVKLKSDDIGRENELLKCKLF